MKRISKLLLLNLLWLVSIQLFAKEYYVGEIKPTEILQQFDKFKKHQNDVVYTEEQLKPLKTISDKIEIKIYFGQWCHDSQREVPRLIQLFSQLNNSNFDVWYYGLNTQKSDPLGLAEQSDIKKTPTIIIFKNGQEIDRILEFPQQDWAADLAAIIHQ